MLGHDKMILCLVGAHTFLTRSVRPFLSNQRVKIFLVSFVSFYQQTLLATFCFILLRLSIQSLRLEIHSFKPLRYTWECNN